LDPKLQASEEIHMRKVLLVFSVIALATTAHVAPTMVHRWRRSVSTSWAKKPARARDDLTSATFKRSASATA
jgi:hypothetical protein